MKVVVIHRARLIRRWKIGEKLLGDRVYAARWNDVAHERRACQRVVDRNRSRRLRALREIPLAFERSGNGLDRCVRVLIASAEVTEEEKRGRVLHQFRNHQRSTRHQPESGLCVSGLSDILSGNRKRLGVEGRIAQREKGHAVNPVGPSPVAELPRARRPSTRPAPSAAARAAGAAESTPSTSSGPSSGAAARITAAESRCGRRLRGHSIEALPSSKPAARWGAWAGVRRRSRLQALAQAARHQKCVVASRRLHGAGLRRRRVHFALDLRIQIIPALRSARPRHPRDSIGGRRFGQLKREVHLLGHSRRNRHFLRHRLEAEHFYFDRPGAIAQIGKRVPARGIRRRYRFSARLGRGHRRSRNRLIRRPDNARLRPGTRRE